MPGLWPNYRTKTLVEPNFAAISEKQVFADIQKAFSDNVTEQITWVWDFVESSSSYIWYL